MVFRPSRGDAPLASAPGSHPLTRGHLVGVPERQDFNPESLKGLRSPRGDRSPMDPYANDQPHTDGDAHS